MGLFTRRGFLKGVSGVGLGLTGLGSWAFALEPGFMMDVTRYHLTPRSWPADLQLRIVAIADVHACEPWMSAERVRRVCLAANAMRPDMIVLLGDYYGGTSLARPVPAQAWGEAMSVLTAPLGVFGVIGNHDIWHGPLPNMRGDNGETVIRTLQQASVTVLENKAVRVVKDGKPFWMVGLADQMAYRIARGVFRGRDDLPGALKQVTDDAPAILLAHEPFIFPKAPKRVTLTLAGHTHGGQVNIPGVGNPLLNKRLRTDYQYGHVEEDGRHMIVSAGLGVSIVPARFMRPPELVEVTLGGAPSLA
jgi:predicted MPP superfamily phosphohydrolase